MLALFLAVSASSVAAQGRPSGVEERRDPVSQLQQLIDDFTRRRGAGRGGGSGAEAARPSLDSLVGDSTFGNALIKRAQMIDTSRLTHQQQLSLGILKWQGWVLEQQPRLYWYDLAEMPPYTGSLHFRAAGMKFRTPSDLSSYLTLVDGAASALDAAMNKARAQAERGIMVSRTQVDRILPYFRQYAATGDRNPFLVAPQRLAAIPPAMADSFRSQIAQRVSAMIAPKAAAIVDHLDHEVRRRGPAHPGLAGLPGGKEAYAIKLQIETTLPGITPKDVYQRGLAAIAALDKELADARLALGFRGSSAEFKKQLQRDPRFYARTPDELGQHYLAAARRIEPSMPRYFERLTKAPYGVKRLDPESEAIATFGQYAGRVPGDTAYYEFNGSHLDQRSVLDLASTGFHELLPGHHYQIKLNMENDSVPPFRRRLPAAGYTEGWAEYASSVLARELGMYADLYHLYGRLGHDAIFAARIVVDPGLNYFGWTRERAAAYMSEHTLHSSAHIESESWRYAAFLPAQATNYRMGRDVFLELRQKAQRALGPQFDIRRFHTAVLDSGALPLFLLQQHIEWWIQREQKLPPRPWQPT